MNDREYPFASAIIYVHNAESRIERFLKGVMNFLEENFTHSEIVCVNDASDDKSVEIIENVSQYAESTVISVVNMSYFHGLELAMNAGEDIAIGDYVFEFDNPSLDFAMSLPMDIYRHAQTGYDIVSASPNKNEKFTSRLFYFVFDKFSPSQTPMKLSTESFRLLSRRAINRISSMNMMIPYRKAVYANCGLKTDNVKYDVLKREHETESQRESKSERRYRVDLAMDSMILFTEFGYKFSMSLTVISIFVSLFMVFYSLAIYMSSRPIEGWTTTILFLSVVFLGLFGMMTIMVKYLQIILNIIFRRKHYSFTDVQKFSK